LRASWRRSAEFIKADGTPVLVASPPRLVVSGFYRYVRNPIYVGLLAVLIGEVLLFGSPGLLEYARHGLVYRRSRRPVNLGERDRTTLNCNPDCTLADAAERIGRALWGEP
jgi:Phospholipid methyltransferase